MTGFVLWFTGLSGAGKSTLAAMLGAELRARGVHVELLDGDEVRTHLSKGLSFSREDRDINVRRIGFVAKVLARAGACAITAAISPYRAIRDEQRAQIARFVEVYCAAEIPALADRDPKGLYKKALAGEIKHFTGIDDPYEPPLSPEITVHTDRETKEESLAKIINCLENLDYIPRRAGQRSASAARLIAPHGGELSIRWAAQERREALAERARGLPAIDLDPDAEVHLGMIASGALSPLKGFLGEKDWRRVTREMRLENGLPWPVPVTLELPEALVKSGRIGDEIALRSRVDKPPSAILEISDIFRPGEPFQGTLVGGEVTVFDEPARGPRELTPEEARALWTSRGIQSVAAFAATTLPRRAEEHLAKTALEVTGALWIRALRPTGAAGRLPFDVRVRCYDALLSAYFPQSRVLFSTSATAAGYEGARRSVLEALIAQNHGASHAVLVDAGAARAFSVYSPSEIGVTPLFLEPAFYSTRAASMATTRTAPGDPPALSTASEDDILAAIWAGELPPAEILRPEVSAILRSWAT